jgi:hypothetical protein
MSARIIELIECDELRGNGRSTMARRVMQLRQKNGELIAEYDPCGRSWYIEKDDPDNPRTEEVK